VRERNAVTPPKTASVKARKNTNRNSDATSSARPQRRQKDRNAETRLRLLTSAARALFELGYAGASIGVITKRAGLTKGAHLHHFQTKEQLMRATIEFLFSEVRIRQEHVALRWTKDVQIIEQELEEVASAAFDWRFISLLELWMASRTEASLHRAFSETEARHAAARRSAMRDVFGDAVMDRSSLPEIAGGFNFLLRGLFLQQILGGDWRTNKVWQYWRHEIAQRMSEAVASVTPSASTGPA
jgi:AcrR family transcriptional regulator